MVAAQAAVSRHRSWQLVNPEDGKRKIDIAVKPAMLAKHSETLLRASVMGASISAQSIDIDIAASLLNSGASKRVLSPWITGRHTLYAALPSRNFIPQRTSVFLEFMMDYTRRMIRQTEKKSR